MYFYLQVSSLDRTRVEDSYPISGLEGGKNSFGVKTSLDARVQRVKVSWHLFWLKVGSWRYKSHSTKCGSVDWSLNTINLYVLFQTLRNNISQQAVEARQHSIVTEMETGFQV